MLQIDSLNAWMELYKKLVFWQMELQTAGDNNLLEILDNQRKEANALLENMWQKIMSIGSTTMKFDFAQTGQNKSNTRPAKAYAFFGDR